MLKGKNVILGVCGGIAAYKSVYLLRLLVKAGAQVQVVMTPSGREFVTPVTFSSLSGRPVINEFFTANTGSWNSHVDLGLWADVMVIAPATACTIGKMANGVADNMLVTTYLSAKCPVLVAPAMDLDMMAHPSTIRNIELLRNYGNGIVEPGSGELASGLVGKGRMAEPEEIIAAVEAMFAQEGDMLGKRVLITAGPTYEKIDPVRFIGNYSSGKMGYAIATEMAKRGAEVTIVSGPVSLPCPDGVKRESVESAEEMLKACEAVFSDVDVAVMCAAVADYRVETMSESKIKREEQERPVIRLKRNPDIAATLGAKKTKNQMLVGFALETDNEIENAKAKIFKKNLDCIVLNSLRDKDACFHADTNKVTILTGDGTRRDYGLKSKASVAKDIVDFIVDKIGKASQQ